MKTFQNIIVAVSAACCFASCGSTASVSLLCDEQHVELYVDDEYVGRGLVNYTVPKGQDEIRVSCREGGEEVYNRSYYVKGMKNQLIEITIPKDYRYSSGQGTIKSKVK